MSEKLHNLLNQATPFAPSGAEDAAGRLRNRSPGTAGPSASPPPIVAGRRAEAGSSRESSALVFVPTAARHSESKQSGTTYELRELAEGAAGLAVYTSLEKLLQVLGVEQAYVEVEIIELLRQVAGRVPVVVDPALRTDIN